MVEISNIPEKFFREIRQIEIFNAKEYSFTANSTGKSVSADPKIIFKNIVPEDFDRSIKRISKNTFFEVDLSFNLYNISPMNISAYSVLLNKKGFAIRLVTNVDSMILGNEQKPFMVEVHDGRKDDNSGSDRMQIQISGATIIEPKAQSL